LISFLCVLNSFPQGVSTYTSLLASGSAPSVKIPSANPEKAAMMEIPYDLDIEVSWWAWLWILHVDHVHLDCATLLGY